MSEMVSLEWYKSTMFTTVGAKKRTCQTRVLQQQVNSVKTEWTFREELWRTAAPLLDSQASWQNKMPLWSKDSERVQEKNLQLSKWSVYSASPWQFQIRDLQIWGAAEAGRWWQSNACRLRWLNLYSGGNGGKIKQGCLLPLLLDKHINSSRGWAAQLTSLLI